MIKIVAENYIKEEYQEEFLKLTKELIILSREEKGNISYHLYQDNNEYFRNNFYKKKCSTI